MNQVSKGSEILGQAVACFHEARQNLMYGAKYLYQIQEEKLYLDEFSSFGQFVEEQCKISQGMASKLVQVYKHYCVEGGVSQRKIESIETERLYLALKMPGDAHSHFEKAANLSRSELKQQRIYEETGHECEHTPITLCSKCHARL